MNHSLHIPMDDLALYAIGDLAAEDRGRISAHLAGCEQCRVEAASFGGEWALVGMSTPEVALPVGARERFLARVEANAAGTEALPNEKKSQQVAPGPVLVAGGRAPRKPVISWSGWAIAAALLLVAAGLGVQLVGTNRRMHELDSKLKQTEEESKRAALVMELMTASQAQHAHLAPAAASRTPSARAVYLASRGALLLDAENLSPVDAGKTYELWILPADGSAPIPAGLFRPDAAGAAHLLLPEIPAGVRAKALGVTIEQAKGATSPTLPIVLAGALDAAGE